MTAASGQLTYGQRLLPAVTGRHPRPVGWRGARSPREGVGGSFGHCTNGAAIFAAASASRCHSSCCGFGPRRDIRKASIQYATAVTRSTSGSASSRSLTSPTVDAAHVPVGSEIVTLVVAWT